MSIRNIADIEALEARPLADRALPRTTYEALAATSRRTPDARALSFFLTADTYPRAFTWTYSELVADITRAANAFHAFGVSADHPVAFVLPNLPETHFAIWGRRSGRCRLRDQPPAGARPGHRTVACCTRARARDLAPAPGIDLWTKLAPHLTTLADLRVVAWVDLSAYMEGAVRPPRDGPRSPADGFEIVDFRQAMRGQPADRLVAPRPISQSSTSSYVCTGGTTGLPKIAVRTHDNEVFDAWAVAQVLGSSAAQRTIFCGLPLFHVNAQLVTGLLPWMQGDHVVLGTPEGYRGQGRHRPVLGDRFAVSRLDVLRRADDLCLAGGCADRRQ